MVASSLDWQEQAVLGVWKATQQHSFWRNYLRHAAASEPGTTKFSIHLAVFNQPYLNFVIEGRKTVESRFSSVRCAPYEQVKKGDVLLLKPVGGPIVGVCLVEHVWFYTLDRTSWKNLRRSFTRELCAQDPEFWRAREHASFATLMRVAKATSIVAVYCEKRDRRGWVVLRRQPAQANLQI